MPENGLLILWSDLKLVELLLLELQRVAVDVNLK